MADSDLTSPIPHSHSPPTSAAAAADDDSTASPASPICCSCGTATAQSWPATSPPPAYRPIRAPAINAPTSTAAITSSPVPAPIPVPPLPLPHHFTTPEKRITSPEHLTHFHASPAARHFLGFIAALSLSARGRKLSDPVHVSPVTSSLLSLISSLSANADAIPPLPQPARYGNPAFRNWHNTVQVTLLLNIVPDHLRLCLDELLPYLMDSFGNPTRIDYGTGHETNFAAFLYCLARLGLIEEQDYPAVVTRVFAAYVDLMRKLQMRYSLEPAGSHGVWGLDDYCFLPYVFGSAQLMDHKYMKPKSIHNDDILENFANEYMYLACIAFIKKVKKGPFCEHSPMLDDISGVPNWGKVNSGLLKMYKAEVLEKVPIMQHFLFGSIIKWE